MPNWIINTLSAKGDPARIREFLETMKNDEEAFDFTRIYPEWNEPLDEPPDDPFGFDNPKADDDHWDTDAPADNSKAMT